MKIGFNPKNEITNPSDLFGRDIVFQQLVSLANRKSCVQVIGHRKFGKTSLLRCLENYLLALPDATVYPIFIDFKEVGDQIKGTANVYRYLIAVIVSRLTRDNFYTDPEDFRNQRIVPSRYWEDIYSQLTAMDNVRIPGIFEEVVLFFSDLIEKTFLCLIDEYEYLFKFCFDKPQGFMKLRTFASKLNSKGLNPFSFFVAGGITWDKLCSIEGSGEMNCIDTLVRVTPIDGIYFSNLWQHEVNLITNCNGEIVNGSQFAFKASGGVPFYGKVIGSSWLVKEQQPSYETLKSHFQEIISSLETQERDILFKLSNGKAALQENSHIYELRESGLLRKDGSCYVIAIDFLRQYMLSLVTNKHRENHFPQSFELSDSVSSLLENINNTHKTKRNTYIFEPVINDLALFRDLRTVCNSSKDFSSFASSLYKIVFEKTKQNDIPKTRLPKKFRNTPFIQAVDIMRHSLGGGHLMDTFNQRSGQMKKEEMLLLLTGNKNEPFKPEDYYNLQIATLKMFETELNSLNSYVRSLS